MDDEIMWQQPLDALQWWQTSGQQEEYTKEIIKNIFKGQDNDNNIGDC